MKKAVCSVLLLILLLPLGAEEPFPAGGSLLSLRDLPGLLEENSPAWRNLETRTAMAATARARSAWDFRPGLTVGLTPLYGWITPVAGQDQVHTAGVSLGSSWLLPSDGVLGLSASDTVVFGETAGNTVVTQNPTFTLSYRQPLWVNGRLLAPELYRASRQLSLDLPEKRSSLAERQGRNLLIQEGAALFSGAEQSRIRYELKKKEVELLRKELGFLEQRRAQGQLSGSDFWSRQITTSQAEDLLLELEYQVRESAEALTAALGLEELPGFSPDLPRLSGPVEASAAPLDEVNPGLREKELALREQELAGALAGKAEAGTLSLEVSVSPSPAAAALPADSLGSSFSLFFEEDARLNPSITLSYTASLKGQAQNRLDRRANDLSLNLARAEYNTARDEARRTLESLYNKQKMLELKEAQVAESTAFMESLVKKEEELLKIASSTTLQLEWARWNRDSRAADLRAVQWELIQNRLALGAFTGEDLASLLEKEVISE